MRTLVVAFLFVSVVAPASSSKGAENSDPIDSESTQDSDQGITDGNITLDQAIKRALELNPSLAAGAFAVSAAEARITQAGLFPNPEVALEAENFGGQGEIAGYNAAETTAIVSQPIPLGRRRGKGRAVAESDHLLTGRDLEAARFDVISDTTSAFYRVLAAQKRLDLAEKMLELANRFAQTVQARVEAGKVSPVEATRASIEVAQTRVRLARAARELEASRVLLSATWGSSTLDFGRANGELPETKKPPEFERLREYLEETPEMARLEEQIERRRRTVGFEKSLRVPDLTISVGPRRFEETGESAWVAGLSVPVPIFDRNQGARKAAEFDLERAKHDARGSRVTLEARLTAALERLEATATEVRLMGEEVVPAANEAFVATETGYSAGKFGFLNLLDAQRALFEAHSLLLDSREEYSLTRTEIERLIGRPMGPQANTSTLSHHTSQGVKR